MTTHSPQQCDGLWRESSSTQCSFWLNASTIHLRLMYLSTLSLSPLARQLVSCSCPALTARPNTTSRLLSSSNSAPQHDKPSPDQHGPHTAFYMADLGCNWQSILGDWLHWPVDTVLGLWAEKEGTRNVFQRNVKFRKSILRGKCSCQAAWEKTRKLSSLREELNSAVG